MIIVTADTTSLIASDSIVIVGSTPVMLPAPSGSSISFLCEHCDHIRRVATKRSNTLPIKLRTVSQAPHRGPT